MKLNVNVLLNTILNISIASSSIMRAPEGSEVGNFAQFARRKYENLKPVNKRWNPVSCSLNKRSNYTKREDADTGVGNADTGVGNARVSSQEMFDNYLKYYGLYGLDIDMTPYKEVYDAVRLPKQIFWMVFGLLWAVYVVVTTVMYMRLPKSTNEFKFKKKSMTLVVVVTGFIYTSNLIAQEALIPRYPCFIKLFIAYTMLAIFLITMLFRIFHYYCQLRINSSKTKISSLINEEMEIAKARGEKHDSKGEELPGAYGQKNILDEAKKNIRFTKKLMKLTSQRNFLITIGVFAAIGIALSLFFTQTEEYSISPINYYCSTSEHGSSYYIYLIIITTLVLFVPLIMLCTGFKDAFGLQLELISSMIVMLLMYISASIYSIYADLKIFIVATGSVFVIIVFIVQYNLCITVPLIRYKRKCAKIYFGNKTEDKKNEMTRKAQFEGLLSYYSGFVRLMYSASISFCPENAEFLKDYQALKYVVCSYLSSELEMSKASKKGGNYSSSKEYSNVNLSGDPAKDENGDSLDLFELIDLNMLISGDVVPPLPGTIAEAVYKMQLMPILNKINEGEGVVGRTTSKQTKVPKKLVYRFRGIYLKYLEKDALLDIELSEKSILTSITEQAKKENYTLSIFDKVLEDVLKSLYENTYPVMLEKL